LLANKRSPQPSNPPTADDVLAVQGASEFRSDRPGNSNAGHEFNDGAIGNGVIGRKLTVQERMQIIETL